MFLVALGNLLLLQGLFNVGSYKVGLGLSAHLKNPMNRKGVGSYISDEVSPVPKPRKVVSLLETLEEFVMVGQTMGYSMDGCLHNIAEVINKNGASLVDNGIVSLLMCTA